MTINFKEINYLSVGNQKQRDIYRILVDYQLLEILKNYQPIVVGTIPIDIDIDGSDIDIILKTNNFEKLEKLLENHFFRFPNFQVRLMGQDSLVCNFTIEDFPIELYAQNMDTDKQYGYLHMVKEYEILQSKDDDFAHQIRNLKSEGFKTEPAFCKLLGIEGDPYVELLNYEVRQTKL